MGMSSARGPKCLPPKLPWSPLGGVFLLRTRDREVAELIGIAFAGSREFGDLRRDHSVQFVLADNAKLRTRELGCEAHDADGLVVEPVLRLEKGADGHGTYRDPVGLFRTYAMASSRSCVAFMSSR